MHGLIIAPKVTRAQGHIKKQWAKKEQVWACMGGRGEGLTAEW